MFFFFSLFAGSMFTAGTLGEPVYPDTPMGLEDHPADTLDHMFPPEVPPGHHPTINSMGSIVNPIDKLYSMQSSYFE